MTFMLEEINPQTLTWVVDEVRTCDPIYDPNSVPPVILLSRDGRIKDVIDGFHRLSGMILSGCTSAKAIIYHAERADETEKNLVAAAADPNGYSGIDQDDAIECIYRAAGAGAAPQKEMEKCLKSCFRQ